MYLKPVYVYLLSKFKFGSFFQKKKTKKKRTNKLMLLELKSRIRVLLEILINNYVDRRKILKCSISSRQRLGCKLFKILARVLFLRISLFNSFLRKKRREEGRFD